MRPQAARQPQAAVLRDEPCAHYRQARPHRHGDVEQLSELRRLASRGLRRAQSFQPCLRLQQGQLKEAARVELRQPYEGAGATAHHEVRPGLATQGGQDNRFTDHCQLGPGVREERERLAPVLLGAGRLHHRQLEVFEAAGTG